MKCKLHRIAGVLTFYVLLTAIAPLHAGADSPVSSHLTPIAFLVGDWETEIDVDEGHYRFEISIAPDAGGHIMTGHLKTYENGRLISTSREIFFWKPESKKISAISFNSYGRRFSGDLTHDGDRMSRQWTGIDENGKSITGKNLYERIEDDSMRFQMTQVRFAGKKMPDQPVLTVRRVVKD